MYRSLSICGEHYDEGTRFLLKGKNLISLVFVILFAVSYLSIIDPSPAWSQTPGKARDGSQSQTSDQLSAESQTIDQSSTEFQHTNRSSTESQSIDQSSTEFQHTNRSSTESQSIDQSSTEFQHTDQSSTESTPQDPDSDPTSPSPEYMLENVTLLDDNSSVNDDHPANDSSHSDDSRILNDDPIISSVHYSCSYDGVRHDFILDLPVNEQSQSTATVQAKEGTPLVILLHGYGSTAEAFRRDTGFHEDACPLGYTVAYVTGAPDQNDHTSAAGWNYDDREDGNKDVEFLSALAGFIADEYHTDRSRCYAAGFSNGGFMCHRLAVEAADTFSAVVSVSGLMSEHVWEKRPDTLPTGVFQLTGEKDETIPKNSDGSAKYAKAPAIEDVMDYYAAANGLDRSETIPVGKNSTLTKYDSPDTQVWHLIVKDGRHSWSAENVTGINTNQLILEYLDAAR